MNHEEKSPWANTRKIGRDVETGEFVAVEEAEHRAAVVDDQDQKPER